MTNTRFNKLWERCERNGMVIFAEHGAEACDVTIRCYLLSSCISEALEDMEDEFDAAHGGENGENK